MLFDRNVAVETLSLCSDLAHVVLSSCFICEFLLFLRLFSAFYTLIFRFRVACCQWDNTEVVFRATFVSRRGAIIDLYTATLKRGTLGLDAKFFIVQEYRLQEHPGYKSYFLNSRAQYYVIT